LVNFFLIVIICVFSIIFIYIIIPSIIKIILRKNFLEKIEKNCVYLTFDDGPNAQYTPKILNILKNANIKATFFLSGKNMKKFPELVTKIIEDGHEIGNHSYEHLHPWKIGPLRTWKDLIVPDKMIGNYLGSEKAILFRPPFGKLNIISILYIVIKRRKPIFWNIDPEDYNTHSVEKIVQTVMNNLSSYSVILLHDDRSKGTISSVQVTLNALKRIIRLLGSNYSFKTISESF
jgi:peptidoglycan/xylan/chitin deacetylase (PgdA/CDA1 family)